MGLVSGAVTADPKQVYYIARHCTHAAGATAAIALAMAATAGSCRDTHGPLHSGLDFY